MAGARATSVGPEGNRLPPGEFESFFREQYQAVVQIAQRVLNDVHAAQDVAQDVFIAAERKFEHPRSSDHAQAWVRVAAVHAALNVARGQRRRRLRHMRSGAPLAPADPEQITMDRITQSEVREALGRLPERQATMLVLRYSGLSYSELAGTLKVDVRHVGTMLRRAEARLRKEIEDATLS